jgi:hypothetical protein
MGIEHMDIAMEKGYVNIEARNQFKAAMVPKFLNIDASGSHKLSSSSKVDRIAAKHIFPASRQMACD